MKKIALFSMSILLLCGGLFCLHLAAQPGRTDNTSAPVKPISLLDPKITELGEQELLELKVESHRKLIENVEAHAQAGSPRGRPSLVAEAHANLAAAEIELYRHTGEQAKLLAAHKARVEAMTNKFRMATDAVGRETMTTEELLKTEIQLLDALLEQKRDQSR